MIARAIELLRPGPAPWAVIAVLLLSLVAVGSLAQLPGPVTTLSGFDKVQHLVAYATLGWWAGANPHRLPSPPLFLFLAAYGAVIELLQQQLLYRQFEWADMLANAVGAALGLCAVAWARTRLS